VFENGIAKRDRAAVNQPIAAKLVIVLVTA
jgi:hypothetical protein